MYHLKIFFSFSFEYSLLSAVSMLVTQVDCTIYPVTLSRWDNSDYLHWASGIRRMSNPQFCILFFFHLYHLNLFTLEGRSIWQGWLRWYCFKWTFTRLYSCTLCVFIGNVEGSGCPPRHLRSEGVRGGRGWENGEQLFFTQLLFTILKHSTCPSSTKQG